MSAGINVIFARRELSKREFFLICLFSVRILRTDNRNLRSGTATSQRLDTPGNLPEPGPCPVMAGSCPSSSREFTGYAPAKNHLPPGPCIKIFTATPTPVENRIRITRTLQKYFLRT